MRVFVAGASGAIGRPLVPKLVAAGHEVTGMTRSEERAEACARPARARPSWTCSTRTRCARRSRRRAPEVVVHELTSLPDRLDFRKEDVYEPTNRVRTEGTRNLLDAARAAGARRFVCQSIAFAYRPEGARVKTEDEPLMETRPGDFGSGITALREMEAMVLGAEASTGSCSATASSTAPAPTTADDGHDHR